MNQNNRKISIFGLLPIIFVISLTVYFTILILKYPLIGIEVVKKDKDWVVDKIYEKGWAVHQPITKGDVIVLVDEKKANEHSTIKNFNRVEMAKTITILHKQTEKKTYPISYNHMDSQYVVYLLLPFLFAITIILLSIFLYRRKREDKSAVILIFFLVSLGICYLSASGSARGDIVSRVSTTITLPGSFLLFIHFLKIYFTRYNLLFVKSRFLFALYILYFSFLTAEILAFIFQDFRPVMKIVELIMYVLFIGIMLLLLTRFCIKYKDSEGNSVLKILLTTLFASFSPFACLYAIPNIFFHKGLVSAEVTAAFLIILPLVFVYLQLAEKLFDIEFLLNRLRYYSLISFPFTFLITMMLCFLLKIQPWSSLTIIIFLLLFTCTTIFFYIKEYIDYKFRHHLFSEKSNFETSLYKFFQKAKYETKVNSLIINLMNEIKDVLMVKDVIHIEVEFENEREHWLIRNRNNYSSEFVHDIEKINWENHQIGSLVEIVGGFGIVIGGLQYKHIIFCGLKKFKTNLNIQERIWLETLAYFSSILLENFQLIEDLIRKIEDFNEEKNHLNDSYPSWLSRLLFSLSEKERMNLSIDLHDSVLQDQLQLLRDVEAITERAEEQTVKNDLFELKERVLDTIHLIRETCNELRPPFLSELGIIPSIQNLIDQTKLRSNFFLSSELDQSVQMLDKDYELTLYRVVQELLNNAMKHSLATEVKISLKKHNESIFLEYEDNGQGIDMTKLNDSFKTMGLAGMKERVKSIGGMIEISSTPGKGMRVFVAL